MRYRTICCVCTLAAVVFAAVAPVRGQQSDLRFSSAAEIASEETDDDGTKLFESLTKSVFEEASLQQPPVAPVRPPVRPTQPQRPVAAAARRTALVSLASIPFMIGDTAGGSCASFSFLGAQEAAVEHPTLACSRLNISENNSAHLRDRVYVSYRHFHNVTETKLFTTPTGFQFQNDLNIDRITIGAEKTFFNGQFSLEARVPMSRELASRVDVILDDSDPSRNTLPLTDRDGEFGNVSAIGKIRLFETERFLLSGGVGVMAPTAEDVIVDGDFFAGFIVIEHPVIPLIAFTDLDFGMRVRNETVNVLPFLSWLWQPNDRFFHQGFLQVDIPTNPSDIRVTADGTILSGVFVPGFVPLEFIPVSVDETGEFVQQTLLRMNFGFGYWIYDNPRAGIIQRIAGLLELHYTTTLQDAKLFRTEVFKYTVDNFGLPTDLPVDLALGNGANRVDILNLTLGCAVESGNTTITNGFVMPLSTGDDKAFDFEYNLQIQHQF
jgi:hypothetical protein